MADDAGLRSARPPTESTDAAAAHTALLDEIARLNRASAAQARVIRSLVTASEERAQNAAGRLGAQRLVEQRTARIHHAERVLRSVLDALDGALCIVGSDARVLDANARWPGTVGADFFAWCRETPDLHHLLADVAAAVSARIADPRAPAQVVAVKGQIGSEEDRRWVVMRVHAVTDHAEARAVVTLLDITDGMATQEQLRRTTEEASRLALVAQATDHAVVITDAEGRIEWANVPFGRFTGLPLETLTGRLRHELVDDLCVDTEEFQSFLDKIRGDGAADGEFAMTGVEGRTRWLAVQVRPVVEDGRREHLVWVEQDVTAERATQQRLRRAIERSEALTAALTTEKTLLDAVINAIPQLVYWKDPDGSYRGANGAFTAFRARDAAALIGSRDLPGHDDPVAETLTRLEREVATGRAPVLNRNVDLPDAEGRFRSMLVSVLPMTGPESTGVIGVAADISHAREMERQLAQANRLESIGQLASGIAHEINTPIQFITDNTAFVAESTEELLRALRGVRDVLTTTGSGAGAHADGESGPPDPAEALDRVRALLAEVDLDFLQDEVPTALHDARDGLVRVAQIVRAMKDYAHPGVARSEVDVNHAIETTVQVARNEWKYVADVRLDLDPEAGLIPGYEGELKQVVLNMIVNAAQAIEDDPARTPDTPLGVIAISTRRERDDFVVRIRDDGPGMSPAVRARVFDPFFTTKDVGRGTGQGLALAHSVIVTKHGGRIELETAPGAGTEFTLHLPLTARTDDDTPLAPAPQEDARP